MKLDRAIREKIEEVVTPWVGRGKMFTAFEVSLAVKEQGVRERHRNMRETVHDIIFRIGGPAGYTRTLMDVGAPEQAWVYHRMGDNPYTYQPLDRTGMPQKADPSYVVPSGVRNPVKLSSTVKNPYAIPDGAYGTDQRGRVCIPVTMLQTLGVGPGDRVEVLCDAANEEVQVTRPGGQQRDDVDTSYTVEGDGNVRITQGTLMKANLDGLQTYRIDGGASMITIQKFAWD
jgi:bifunctional DNA-binding transcriptional regulator/antitoxin component of YhaV-PrlF toxin-antitoxin module